MRFRVFPSLQNVLRRYSSPARNEHEFDLVVVGGGSGGLACAKEAADLGMKVAVMDFVEPSPQGTKWGLGGTCVNVGCIPKKLMHQAALLGENLHDARHYGWDVPERVNHSWERLSLSVQNYVKSLNFGHMVQLRERDVTYMNAKGKFVDRHTISALNHRGKERQLTTKYAVIAVGGRPVYPQIPGIEKAITSDDIFWKKTPPGKTLVIGGSYVALECGGFLNGLGYDTSIMVRSICLRGFDQQMASLVKQQMSAVGTRFLQPSVPLSLSQESEDAPILVAWRNSETKEEGSDHFDTVLVATGRAPLTKDLNLESAGVDVSSATGKVIGGHGGETERSSAGNIFAIGDVLEGGLELTPVAAQSGRLLARRLAGTSSEMMDYLKVPTTVFTPLEYACAGLSEEAAIESRGEDGIEVYHAFYKPLEFTVPQRDSSNNYMKVICDRSSGAVLGVHLSGVGVGEMMQGFAVALRLGLSFDQLVSTVGIHPTCAEELVKLNITKRSGKDPTVTGC